MGHNTLFHVTITGYPELLEPHPISLQDRIEAFKALSKDVGPERVWWRYDPIILTQTLDWSYHFHRFQTLCGALRGSTTRVTFSLLDPYQKTRRRLKPLETTLGPVSWVDGTEETTQESLRHLAKLARNAGMRPVVCCEPHLEEAGLEGAPCIDAEAVRQLFNLAVTSRADPGQRTHCLCAASHDIGAPDTCIGGCPYCYSTRSTLYPLQRNDAHDPESEFLFVPNQPIKG